MAKTGESPAAGLSGAEAGKARTALLLAVQTLGINPERVERAERERDYLLEIFDTDNVGDVERVGEFYDYLVVAAHEGFDTIVEWLLGLIRVTDEDGEDLVGSEWIRPDLEGWTALHAAILGGHAGIVKKLLEAGTNYEKGIRVSSPNGLVFGWRPLMMAAQHGHSACMIELLAAGASVNAQNEDGLSALHFVALQDYSHKYQHCTRLLLDKGADVDLATTRIRALRGRFVERGCTPLIFAAINNNLGIVEILLRAGADKALVDNGGKTALQHAKAEGNSQVVELLRR